MVKLPEDRIKEMIIEAENLEIELYWIPKIMALQTDEEQEIGKTTERNNQGLNAYDSETITEFYNMIQSDRHLSDKQIAITKDKLVKYSRQYSEILR